MIGENKMKKVIAIILALVFVFTLSACGNKDIVSDVDISESTKGEAFIKPENYASVLLVSINPQFKLYLDEINKVLAVEPVNDDAKSFCDNIDFENKSVEAVVGNIVEKANEKGFIKENAVVNFEMTEQKDGVDSSNILTTVVSAANQKATELKIEIKTEIKESDNSKTAETNSENKQTGESSKSETSSKNEGNTSKPTTSTKPAEGKPTESSKPTHTHSYSAATCTAPQKCSCGETKGSALGHKWQDATCEVPKICSVCKATDGNKSNHTYDSNTGICSVCNVKDANFKFKPLDTGIWEFSTNRDNLLLVCQIGFQWPDFTFFGLSRPATTQELNSGEVYTIKYNGIHYLCEFSSGEIVKSEENGDTIVITYEASWDEPKMTLKRTANDTLVVTSLESEFPCSDSIKVGSKFTLKTN